MSLTTASQITHRARCAQAVSIGACGPAIALVPHRQQTRGLRFHRTWPSSLESDCRHRHMKYAETLNRRLSWEKQPNVEDTKQGMKGMVRNYWGARGNHRSTGGPSVDADVVSNNKTSQSFDGDRPGHNIEDAERAPMEHFLFGDKGRSGRYEYDFWQSPLQNIRSSLRHRMMGTQGKVSDVAEDFIYDPVANRKVPRSSLRPLSESGSGDETPITSFRQYRSHFTSQSETQVSSTATDSDGRWSWTCKKVRWHGQVPLGSWAPTGTHLGDASGGRGTLGKQVSAASTPVYDDLAKYRLVMEDPRAADEASAPKYEDLDRYNINKILDPETRPQHDDPVPKYDDLGSYGAVRADEPDGKYKTEAEKAEDEVDPEELGKYSPLRSHEPDGKYKPQKDQKNTDEYDPEELAKYKPVRSHEPDGRYRPVMEQTKQDEYGPEELAKYQPLRSHEPDGKYKPVLEKTKLDEYDPAELARYRPVRTHEPDGKYKPESVKTKKDEYDPEELARYGAVRVHEPDGKYKVEQTKPVRELDPEELARYGAFMSHEPDGKYAESYKKSQHEDDVEPAELVGQYDQGFRSHEPDGKYADRYKKSQHEDDEEPAEVVGQYDQGFRSHEPDGKYAERFKKSPRDDDKEPLEVVGQYDRGFRSHEPDGKYAERFKKSPRDDDKEPPEVVGQYDKGFRSNEPDGKYAERAKMDQDTNREEEAGAEYNKPYMSHEPDGKYAPKEEQTGKKDDFGGYKASSGSGTLEPSAAWMDKESYSAMVESLLSKYTAMSEAMDKKAKSASEASEQSHERKTTASMTGNFARDFPEEFARSWSASGSSLLPEEAAASEHSTPAPVSISEENGAARLQPALDRWYKPGRAARMAATRGYTDLYSKEPQGLQTSYEEECGGKSAWPGFVKTYVKDTAEKPATDGPAATVEGSPEPTLYKILAYDTTTQTVNVAETTSVVPDGVAPLTPAEVLLRLSNPAKFFPHFGPLQAQGFEIVSGSGDVLVFRKVRKPYPSEAAAPMEQAAECKSSPASSMESSSSSIPELTVAETGSPPSSFSPGAASPRVNRLDGTGSADQSRDPVVQAAPKFVSGIDVRREEEVFSGPKMTTQTREYYGDAKSKKEKPGVVRRMVVGAVWLGGLSYSLGVVAEYFKTGGADGKGPKGF